jgi:hypothetical protein
MLRLSRPLTLALLWLAIAVLPMRGWAATVMPVTMAAEALAFAASAPADASDEASPMPCHGALIDDSATSSNAGCSHCDVCHAATAVLPNAVAPLPVLPAAHPGLEPSPGVERPVQSGPERPPRSPSA